MPDQITNLTPNFPVTNIVIPGEGPRVLACALNFTDTNSIDVFTLLSVYMGQISYIQGAYVDNSDNPAQLTLVVKTTQQSITIPAYGQGYYPILFAATPDLTVSTTQAAISVKLHFYNVPIQAQQWLTNDAAPAGAGGLTDAQLRASPVPVSGPLTDTQLRATPLPAPIGGAWTDRSIANLTGASQSLMAANANRRHLLIQNVAANNMGVNLAGGAAAIGVAGTITITPGGYLEIFDYPPVGAITIIGTANDDVTAFEG